MTPVELPFSPLEFVSMVSVVFLLSLSLDIILGREIGWAQIAGGIFCIVLFVSYFYLFGMGLSKVASDIEITKHESKCVNCCPQETK